MPPHIIMMALPDGKLDIRPINHCLLVMSFRFKREEAKILAWENHEKAKAEAEMRRIEVDPFALSLFYGNELIGCSKSSRKISSDI